MKPLTMGRINSPSDPPDAVRVLVDRLWPRGVAKVSAPWALWAQGVSPTTELRRWYGHAAERYEEFRGRYWAELEASLPNADMDKVMALWREQPVMLLTASRELDQSHVPVVREFLLRLAALDSSSGGDGDG